jgi:outer membrane protein assembly factor BamB
MSWPRTLVLLPALCAAAGAADWPQWLGPKRDGGSTEKVAAWKKGEEPKAVWSKSVGEGYSAPVVAGGRVFVHSRGPDKDKHEEQVVAYDAAKGTELWKDVYKRPAYKSQLGTGPRATPAVAGKRLFTLGINGVLSCYDVEKGKRHWQVDLYKELKADQPRFGVCCSPLVVGNRVIVSVGGKGKCVVALNVESGKVEWQALDDAASTSSAVLFAGGYRPKGGAPDVVFMTPLRVVGLDPLDGSLRWEYSMTFQPAGTSPTPAIIGDKLVASTQAHGAVAIKVGKKEEKPSAESAWQNKEARSYFTSGVADVKAGVLVLVTNEVGDKPVASLTGLDAKTGKELWKKEAGYYHAGVMRTGDGKLLVLSDAGRLSLWEYDAKGAKELCSATVCAGTLVNPALADGKLYCRDNKGQLVCVQLGK